MSTARIVSYFQLVESIGKMPAYFLSRAGRTSTGSPVAETFHSRCTGNPQAYPQALCIFHDAVCRKRHASTAQL
jgi:hypothetical protein